MGLSNAQPEGTSAADVARRFLLRYREEVGEPADPLAAVDELFAALRQAKVFASEFQRTFLDQRERAAELEAALVDLRQAHEQTELREQRFRELVFNASDTITIIDEHQVILEASPSVERVWGYEPKSLEGVEFSSLVHRADAARVSRVLNRISDQSGAHETVEFRLAHKEGDWRSVDAAATNLRASAAVGGIVLNGRDVTDKRQLEESLAYRANFDSLTGLPNRVLFLDRLEQAFASADRRHSDVALLFIDADRFKGINDTYGHQIGDAFLVQVAERLARGRGRPDDTLARIGGDEFALLIEAPDALVSAHRAAGEILAAFDEPLRLGDLRVPASVSVGLSIASVGLKSGADLVRGADIALTQAKRRGRGQVVPFDAELNSLWSQRLQLEADLLGAAGRGEFRNLYQPLVDLATGTIRGVEALVRWNHPRDGEVSPGEFISVAEEAGFIPEIGLWVLRRACADWRLWQDDGLSGPGPVLMSVNVSPLQLRSGNFPAEVQDTLEQTGMDPALLQLEITEGTFLEEGRSVIAQLEELKSLGVRIAVDDFGTGYSSLAYLSRLPVDVLKIDRSFVSDLGANRGAEAIIEAVTALARGFELGVTAEGVETRGQATTLQQMGVETGQGFLYSRPVPAEALLLPSGKAGRSAAA